MACLFNPHVLLSVKDHKYVSDLLDEATMEILAGYDEGTSPFSQPSSQPAAGKAYSRKRLLS